MSLFAADDAQMREYARIVKRTLFSHMASEELQTRVCDMIDSADTRVPEMMSKTYEYHWLYRAKLAVCALCGDVAQLTECVREYRDALRNERDAQTYMRKYDDDLSFFMGLTNNMALIAHESAVTCRGYNFHFVILGVCCGGHHMFFIEYCTGHVNRDEIPKYISFAALYNRLFCVMLLLDYFDKNDPIGERLERALHETFRWAAYDDAIEVLEYLAQRYPPSLYFRDGRWAEYVNEGMRCAAREGKIKALQCLHDTFKIEMPDWKGVLECARFSLSSERTKKGGEECVKFVTSHMGSSQ